MWQLDVETLSYSRTQSNVQKHQQKMKAIRYTQGRTYFTGGKCQISRCFLQKMRDFMEISRKVICCSLIPQNHLPALIRKAYLRYLKSINVKNVTNGHFTVHWYADRLPGSMFTCSITCSIGKLQTINGDCSNVYAYWYRTLTITIQDIHKKTMDWIALKVIANVHKSTSIGKTLRKCISERAKFHRISRKTADFTANCPFHGPHHGRESTK